MEGIFSKVLRAPNSFKASKFGNAFLFSLPITRKDYVLEKYIFGLISGMTSLLLGTVISLVAILFIYTNNLGKIKLVDFWKFGLLMFFLAYFVILIKQFLYGFKFGFSDYSLQQFQTLEFYTNAHLFIQNHL